MKKAEIVAALTRLNQNYGRGNLVSVDVERGVFVVQPFKLLPETRKFRVKGRTVFALGHQLTVPGGQKEKKMERLAKMLFDLYRTCWQKADTMMIEWVANRLAKEIGYAEAAAEMKEMNRRRKWLRLPVNLPRLGSELSFEYAKLK